MQTTYSHNPNFRYDINGLRAIAVLSVLLFHFSPNLLPGGFAGVDVFFVISGFLMTSIIFRGFENKKFSYLQFVINRAKRIVPALLTVTIVLLIAGYLTLGQDAYKLLGKHARDSLLFISNITYAKENGYFDVSSTYKLLLHTWSLSVEWQFYLIYPAILLILKRFTTIQTLKILIIIFLCISLALSVYITYKNPTNGYFQFYTRAWEMMLGGIAFLYPIHSCHKRYSLILELAGLTLITSAFFMINHTVLWPGYMAIIPVFGTYLCILAHNQSTILKFYPINKIGLWSYSIYLVHWPLLSFGTILGWNLSISAYLSLTLLLSIILYYTIEKRRNYKWGLLISYILILLIAIYARETSGKERFNIPNASQKSLSHGHTGWAAKQWRTFNLKNNAKKVDYIIYGDSFSAQYTSYFKQQSKSIANIYEGECFSTPNYFSYDNRCIELYDLLKQGTKENSSNTLVIAQSWSHILQNLKSKQTQQSINMGIHDFIKNLKSELLTMKQDLKVNKIVLIGINNGFIGPSPEDCISQKFIKSTFEPFFQRSNCQDTTLLQYTDKVENFNEALANLAQTEDWLEFINPNDAICTDKNCIQIENNLSLYSDKSHFSIIGAQKVGEFIFEKLNNMH